MSRSIRPIRRNARRHHRGCETDRCHRGSPHGEEPSQRHAASVHRAVRRRRRKPSLAPGRSRRPRLHHPYVRLHRADRSALKSSAGRSRISLAAMRAELRLSPRRCSARRHAVFVRHRRARAAPPADGRRACRHMRTRACARDGGLLSARIERGDVTVMRGHAGDMADAARRRLEGERSVSRRCAAGGAAGDACREDSSRASDRCGISTARPRRRYGRRRRRDR